MVVQQQTFRVNEWSRCRDTKISIWSVICWDMMSNKPILTPDGWHPEIPRTTTNSVWSDFVVGENAGGFQTSLDCNILPQRPSSKKVLRKVRISFLQRSRILNITVWTVCKELSAAISLKFLLYFYDFIFFLKRWKYSLFYRLRCKALNV